MPKVAAKIKKTAKRRAMPGNKEDVFTLEEGSVVLQWPERLSDESVQDLEDWIQLIIRKAKRSARRGPPNEESEKT